MKVLFPPNAAAFFSYFLEIAQFDLLFAFDSTINEYVFKFSETQTYSNEMELLGFGDSNYIENGQTLFYAQCFNALLFLIYFLVCYTIKLR